MKKLFTLMLALCGLLFITGCADSPQDVAKKYTQALYDGDLAEANKYSTKKTHAFNEIVINASKDKKSDKDKAKLKEALDSIDDSTEQIDGNTAKLISGKKTIAILQKVDGDWKVDVVK